MKMHRKFLISILIFLVTIPLPAISIVGAIPTFYGSFFERQGMWTRLLDTNISLFVSGADFQHSPWEAEDVHQLADHGVKINFRTYWWWQFYNGEIAWNTSVVDIYYNATLMELLEQQIDWQLSYLNPDKIWAVTLSEEEPAGALRFFAGKKLQEHNETYHSETGLWLREEDLYSEPVLNNWQSEKFVSVYNHLHDYIKNKWPHVLVFQFVHTPWPGASPVWVGGLDVTDLKADAYMSDLYYFEAYDNPFWLYEFIRQAKCTFPDKEYHFWLWGQEPWPEGGLTGGFEHIRRNAWLAYLAGVDAIGWFNWHYIHGNMWGREDALGKRLLLYTNRLNKELEKLPPMKPRPQVLVIRDQMMSFQVGLCCDLGLFNEWDMVNQRTFAKKDMDLSQYKLIVVNEDRYYNEVVEKLNQYVKSGGNLIMLGGFGWDQTNIHNNEPRTSKSLIEEGVSQKHIWGDINVTISSPNPLGLDLQYKHVESSMLAIAENTLTENHHPIGEFHLIDENGKLTQIEDCPLVLYHNSSNPEEGSILYWGVVSGPGPAQGIPDAEYRDVVETFLPEWNYTRFLYRNVTRAFARNHLHLNGSLATSGTENMIITQSEIDEGVILAGVSNYYPRTVSINYTLDLDNFNLPPGEYWVHSLDENLTLGRFESQQSLLEVPLSIVANGTKLLLISQLQLDPSYSVNIFPEIPTAEEAELLTPPRFRTIGALEAKQLIDSNPSITILDVRPVDEFDQGHIERAINIPIQELEERLGELKKHTETIVYCSTGVEGTHASQLLIDNGFTKIYNVQGGIISWIRDENYPIVSSPKPSTISITLSATTIDKGEAITISGSISPHVPEVPVELTYTSPRDTEIKRTVTSASDGSFEDTFMPDAAGSWSVSASWEGNEDLEGATGETTSFEVAEPGYIIPDTYLVIGALLIAAISAAAILKMRRRGKSS